MESQMQKLKLKVDNEHEDEDEDEVVAKGDEPRNWLDLPEELTASILSRLGSIEILDSLQKVCKPWYNICKNRSMWKSIDMANFGELYAMPYDLEVMCRHAVDRSGDGLVDITLELFATDELLMYIADRAPGLKRLRVISCYGSITNEGLAQMVAKLPLLEDLDLTIVDVGGEGLTAVGRCCPRLKSLKCNRKGLRYSHPPEEADEDAQAIAETMPELRRLMLFGNQLTDRGLQAILDRCLHLESLDLRQCFNITPRMSAKLEKLRPDRIKDLKLPGDSTADYEFYRTVYNIDDDVVGYSDDDEDQYDIQEAWYGYTEYQYENEVEYYDLDAYEQVACIGGDGFICFSP